MAKAQRNQTTLRSPAISFRIDAAKLSYNGRAMEGIRLNRFAATIATGALLLCLPSAGLAQDTPAQTNPTPAPVLTDPRIPDDFSLPPSDSAPQVVGPARPGDAPVRENALPQPAPTPSPTAAATRQPQIEPEVRRPAPAAAATPRADAPALRQEPDPVSPQGQGATPPSEAQPSDGAAFETASDVAAPQSEPVAPARNSAETAEADETGGWGVMAIALLLMVLAGLAALIAFLRRRGSSGVAASATVSAPEVERPVVPVPQAKPQPVPAPSPPPAAATPAQPSGLVQSRAKAPPSRNESGLVTVRSPSAPERARDPFDGLVTTRVPSSGMVTTNLAKKQRESKPPVKRQAPAPMPVKRNINFDWS